MAKRTVEFIRSTPRPHKQYTFVDIYAGCGGLSLGMMQAGWRGLFAIENDANAFQTLHDNLIAATASYKFCWPHWLPKAPANVSEVLRRNADELVALGDTVDLLVGGPPCQGISSAGRRDLSDPRNQQVSAYLNFVQMLRPRIVLIENV